jgi:hypothetical protein
LAKIKLNVYIMWTRAMLLPPPAESKSALWASFCEYIDFCFERTMGRSLPALLFQNINLYIHRNILIVHTLTLTMEAACIPEMSSVLFTSTRCKNPRSELTSILITLTA